MDHSGVSSYHQAPPEPAQIYQRFEQSLEVEELGLSVRPMIMMHWCLGKSHPDILETLDQLYTYCATRRSQSYSLKARPAHQPEITIDVAYPDLERQLYKPAINLSNDGPVQGIGPAYLVTINDIDVGRHQGKQDLQFANVVLSIPIRVKDQVPGRVGKTGSQRGSIT